MKVLIITGDHPRHLTFAKMLWDYFDDKYIIFEKKAKSKNNFLTKKESVYFDKCADWKPDEYLECETGEINDPYWVEKMREIAPDIMFIFGCSILKSDVFLIPPKGCINIHTGIVQLFRGVDSCFWAIKDEKPWGIGATIHYVDASIDAGDMICQARPKLSIVDDFSDIFLKSCRMGFDCLYENLDIICSGQVTPISLNERGKLYNIRDFKEEYLSPVREKLQGVLEKYLGNKEKMDLGVPLVKQRYKRTVAIIPARGGSERLKGKNIYPVWGKPMLYWAIRACKASKHIDDFYVSTEDPKIKEIAIEYGAKVIDRPPELAESWVYKQDVIVHAAESLEEKPDIVVSLQPNSPEISPVDLDNAIEKFITWDRNEIFTVNPKLIQNAAFRIMRYEYVFQNTISTRSGVFVTNYRDVHNIADIEYLEEERHPAEIPNETKD